MSTMLFLADRDPGQDMARGINLAHAIYMEAMGNWAMVTMCNGAQRKFYDADARALLDAWRDRSGARLPVPPPEPRRKIARRRRPC